MQFEDFIFQAEGDQVVMRPGGVVVAKCYDPRSFGGEDNEWPAPGVLAMLVAIALNRANGEINPPTIERRSGLRQAIDDGLRSGYHAGHSEEVLDLIEANVSAWMEREVDRLGTEPPEEVSQDGAYDSASDCSSSCTKHAYCRRERHVEQLTRERDEAVVALQRVVANESNHYDRYWSPPDESVSDEWLDETEAKMREALEDAFCDDAAAVMLTLIAKIRRLRTEPPTDRYDDLLLPLGNALARHKALHHANEDAAWFAYDCINRDVTLQRAAADFIQGAFLESAIAAVAARRVCPQPPTED